MASSGVTVEQAAERLRQRLAAESWLVAVGVGRDAGQDCVFVYVKNLDPKIARKVGSDSLGYPVVLRRASMPRPLTAVRASLV